MFESLTVWLGAIVTLCVFSYAIKDNPAYRLVQQATLGTYMGMATVIMWNQILQPRWWQRFADGWAALMATNAEVTPQDTPGAEWTSVFWGLAILPGLLWYFQLSKRWFWVSTIISGWFVGVAAGLAFKTQILLIMPQVSATIQPINPFAGPHAVGLAALAQWNADAWATVGECANNLIVIVLLLATLFYFFFSVRTEHPVLAGSIRFGRVTIMICLGALFGNTVMTRVAYLIERLLFLYNDFAIGEIGGWFA